VKVAALVFDFDGLILDTETPLFEEWREAYRRRGCELTLDVWRHSLGTKGGFDPCGHLGTLLGAPVDCEAVRGEVVPRYRARCETQPLLPGVADVVVEARRLGLRTAVASSSSVGWVEGWLVRHGIRPLFDAVCGRDDVERVKPAPDLFLLAASRIGAPPESCVVLEDSPNGMLAARAAGMKCIAVPNNLTRELALPEPDLVVASLADHSLAELLRALGGAPSPFAVENPAS
jgi:beta-phosphoglucomutase-like phosphatase (HAD superfamily)